jgi:hypothetical protein
MLPVVWQHVCCKLSSQQNVSPKCRLQIIGVVGYMLGWHWRDGLSLDAYKTNKPHLLGMRVFLGLANCPSRRSNKA